MSTKDGYFEMISTYFVKIYYKYLYEEAINKTKNNKSMATTIAEEYRSALRAFKDGITKNQNYYYSTIKDIHQEFQKITPATSLTDFIDTVVKIFIPSSFHNNLINDNLRDRWMYKIMCDIIDKFNNKINTSYVDKVIDDKERNTKLINLLQDEFNCILELVKTETHIQLTNQDSTSVISAETYERLEKKARRIIMEKNDKIEHLQKRCEELTRQNDHLLGKIEHFKKQFATIEKERNNRDKNDRNNRDDKKDRFIDRDDKDKKDRFIDRDDKDKKDRFIDRDNNIDKREKDKYSDKDDRDKLIDKGKSAADLSSNSVDSDEEILSVKDIMSKRKK